MITNTYSFCYFLILFIFFHITGIEYTALAGTKPRDITEDYASGGVNIRLRNEYWNTFTKKAVSNDKDYNIFLIRARGFIDLNWDNIGVHLMGQGVKAFDLPENGASGPGSIYFNASDTGTDPGNFQIVEAFLNLKNLNGFYFKGGRIPIKEGAEVLYKDSPKMNWIIKNRLSERLVGDFEWTDLGRRYDGLNAGYNNEMFDVDLFGAYPTYGAFDIDDGYWNDLDRVFVAGATFTLKKDTLIRDTQIKFFDYFYFDDRESAKTIAGDDLEINTIGASLVGVYRAGPGEFDLLLWVGYQFGNFGPLDQNAFAFIAEAGYQFKEIAWKPWLRSGIAYASGDDDPDDGDYGTFFNYLPTNHKYYGYVDANAFSNLIDLYFQFLLSPHSRLNFAVDGHWFWLVSDKEFQIGGSGAFNDNIFGYVYRRPAEGNNIDRNIGGELDLTAVLKVLDYLDLQLGYSHFFGIKGIEVIFDGKDQLD